MHETKPSIAETFTDIEKARSGLECRDRVE